ncbi:MAG: RNA polymerase sigma factor [Muribaculaceae bacterium]|nr:RNA polymerase sigma factor [Muribaculaceae bacterium]
MTREQFISYVKGTQKGFRRFLIALCCGNSSLADDIAQESYLKAYLSSESFRNTDKFKAWIYKIGYHSFLNHRRSQRPLLSVEYAKDVAAGTRSDDTFKYQELYQALNLIPAAERVTVLLFYMENYSIREISELQEISQDAVKQRLSRGRFHLRGLLTAKK